MAAQNISNLQKKANFDCLLYTARYFLQDSMLESY